METKIPDGWVQLPIGSVLEDGDMVNTNRLIWIPTTLVGKKIDHDTFIYIRRTQKIKEAK